MNFDYSLDKLKGDVFGGITTSVVGLPVALAFGVASGLGPTAGMYGAIAVGFFCRRIWRHALPDFRPHRANVHRHGRHRNQPCQQPGRGVHHRRVGRVDTGGVGHRPHWPLRRLHPILGHIGFHDGHRRHHHDCADRPVPGLLGGRGRSHRSGERAAGRVHQRQFPRVGGGGGHPRRRSNLAPPGDGSTCRLHWRP